MAKKSGGADRSVTYYLAIDIDSKAKSSIDRFKGLVTGVYADLDKAASKFTTSTEKYADQFVATRTKAMGAAKAQEEKYAGESLKTWEKLSASIDKQQDADQTRRGAKWAKEIDKQIADSKKAADTKAKYEADMLKWGEAEAAKIDKKIADSAVKSHERTVNEKKAADAQLIESMKGVVGGVASLTRAWYLHGLATEDDKKKAMEQAAGFEATIQGIAGVISVVQEGVGAWHAYKTARAAAATAEAAGGAMSALTGVGGAAAGVGGGASGVVASLSALAGPAVVAAAAFTALGAAMKSVGESVLDEEIQLRQEGKTRKEQVGLFKQLSAEFAIGWDGMFGEGMQARIDKANAATTVHNVGVIGAAGDAGRSEFSHQSELAALQARRGLSGRDADLAENRTAFNLAADRSSAAMSARATAENRMIGSTPGAASEHAEQAKQALKDQLDAQERMKMLTAERSRIEIEGKQKSLEFSKQISSQYERDAQTLKAQAAESKSKSQSFLEKLGEADPLSQQKTLSTLAKLKQGKDLTGEEIGIVRSANLDQSNEALSQQLIRKGQAALGIGGEPSQLQDQNARTAQAEAAARQIDVKIQNEIQVQFKLEDNIQDIENKLIDKLTTILTTVNRLQDALGARWASEGKSKG